MDNGGPILASIAYLVLNSGQQKYKERYKERWSLGIEQGTPGWWFIALATEMFQ